MQLKTLYLNASGLDLFLGPLESVIMRAIWEGNHETRPIWRYVRDRYTSKITEESAYTSVTTTIYRLWQMGYLTRIGDRRSYRYTSIWETEDQFVHYALQRVVGVLLDNYPREVGRLIVMHMKKVQQ